MSDEDKDKYQGPDAWEAGIGRQYIEQARGQGAGFVAGAAIGAALKKPGEKMAKSIANEIHNNLIPEINKVFREAPAQKLVGYAERIAQEAVKRPRGTSAAVFALGAAIMVGTIASLHGLYKGHQSGTKGKEQFDALKVDMNALQKRAELAEAMASGRGNSRG
jgi:hypothetical protein